MANEGQFKSNTLLVATRGVKEYRATIDRLITSHDSVLELGCEWGTTTRLLANRSTHVIGTDMSLECIQRARTKYPDIRFEVLDAFDLRGALALGTFTKIYVDLSGISGYRSLLDAISLAQAYASMFRPEAIVLKCGALKQFARRCIAWEDGFLGLRGG